VFHDEKSYEFKNTFFVKIVNFVKMSNFISS